ncbi:MAG: FAD-dependent oxidoreductase [Oscillochloridaceae bacterium]|nr:FAD-dependent oxidoreductase [Oscillochloridaceae bacterium]
MTIFGRRVVVIGAGVAGLAAARRLRLAGAQVTMLERAPAPGGRVQTLLIEGCRVELGAEFLADFYTRTLELVRELGLAGELRRIPRSAATLRAGRLYPLWPGVAAALTPLVGPRHKVALSYLVGALARHRSQLDTHAFHKAYALDDRSVAEYARAHLSEEVLEYVLQPPLSGIFYWAPERTSRALLFLALRAGLSRPAGMRLYTLREGLGQLPAALAAGQDLHTGVEVETIIPDPGAGYTVYGRVGDTPFSLATDGVIIATTASTVPRLLPWLDDRQRAFFSAVTYSTTTLLAVVVRDHFPRHTYGMFFPRRETPFLAAATLPTVKDPAFAPPDRDVICLRLSGRAAAALRECADDTLACLMLAELRRLAPGFDPAPRSVCQRLYRCDEALPEFAVGHFHRLRAFASGAIELPALAFAGDYLGGPFIEGAIVSGERAAERLLDHLRGG